jgi:zinc protease
MKTAAVAAALVALASPAWAGGVFPYKYQKDVLPNGLTVFMVPLETPGLVAYWSIVRTGSRDEVEPGRSGYAHFFEHMMFRGTKNFPGPVYDKIVTSLGADANAFTTDDLTAYHLAFAKEDLEKVIHIESDRFQNLDYEKPAFQTEAGAIYGEYRKSVTSPFFMLDEKLRETAYDVHTYKHTTMGFERDVKAMPEGYEYSRGFFHRFYRPENVVLLIVGDIQPEKTLALVKKYYGGWQRGYVPPKVQKEPPQNGERKVEVTYPGQTLPILDIAYKGEALDPSSRDFAAGLLLADLAFGPTSELYKKLVIREQKVEALEAAFPMNRDQPLWEIVAMVKKADDIPYVRDEIYRTLEEFKTKPVDAKRLDDARRHNKYAFAMGLNSPENVAEQLARFIALTGGIDVVDRLYAETDRVTPEDVMRATQKVFDAKRRTVATLKPAAN